MARGQTRDVLLLSAPEALLQHLNSILYALIHSAGMLVRYVSYVTLALALSASNTISWARQPLPPTAMPAASAEQPEERQ